MTNWNLVSKGLLGLYWIMECNKVKNANKTLADLYYSDFAQDWNNERLLNSGVLMMASYLLFVYPQQADFDNIDFSQVDISKFKVTFQDIENLESKVFCKRLRNSISHAKFEINEMDHQIFFWDDNSGKNKIELNISSENFGKFIDDFAHLVNQQMILKNNG